MKLALESRSNSGTCRSSDRLVAVAPSSDFVQAYVGGHYFTGPN